MRAGPLKVPMEKVEDPFLENKMPWFNRNCYRVGQDLVCMLSEKFPDFL
jgi:hypothetical protein